MGFGNARKKKKMLIPTLSSFDKVDKFKRAHAKYSLSMARILDSGYENINTIGIDPGVHFGVTILVNGIVYVYEGDLLYDKQHPHDAGYSAFKLMQSDMFNSEFWSKRPFNVIIENASFGSPYGRERLETVRTGLYLGCRLYTNDIQVVPPATIKKEVLGNGKAQAMDVFPTLNHNGADSVSIAFYGAK